MGTARRCVFAAGVVTSSQCPLKTPSGCVRFEELLCSSTAYSWISHRLMIDLDMARRDRSSTLTDLRTSHAAVQLQHQHDSASPRGCWWCAGGNPVAHPFLPPSLVELHRSIAVASPSSCAWSGHVSAPERNRHDLHRRAMRQHVGQRQRGHSDVRTRRGRHERLAEFGLAIGRVQCHGHAPHTPSPEPETASHCSSRSTCSGAVKDRLGTRSRGDGRCRAIRKLSLLLIFSWHCRHVRRQEGPT